MDIEKIRQIVAETEKQFNPLIRRIEARAKQIARHLKENPNWVSDTQTGTILYQIAKGRRCLDVGSFTGFSSHCMALARPAIVDAYDAHLYDQCWKNTSEEKRITQLEGHCNITLMPYASHWRHCPKRHDGPHSRPNLGHAYDLIFLDSSHDNQCISEELDFYLSALAEDGILICHDLHDLHALEHTNNLTPISFAAIKEKHFRPHTQTIGVYVNSRCSVKSPSTT